MLTYPNTILCVGFCFVKIILKKRKINKIENCHSGAVMKKIKILTVGKYQRKISLTITIPVIALTVIILAMSVITVWNAAELHYIISHKTQRYVKDVSLQLASDIEGRLKKITQDMMSLEDSVLKIYDGQDVEGLKEFLLRKADILEFDSLMISSCLGKSYSTGNSVENLYELPGVQDALNGENGVSFLDGQSILYSVPFYKDGQVVGVLSGIRSKSNMQKLIQPHSFDGKGLTCISDSEGKVIISPTDLDPFLRLDNIFTQETKPRQRELQSIYQMRDNMRNHQGGVFTFTSINGSELVLSYDELEPYGWILLTLVPADLITGDTDRYVTRTFLITAGIIIVFALSLLIVTNTFRSHRKVLERIAFEDAITGGMSNAAFQLRCKEMLQKASPGTYTVISLNIKDFKLINENFGSPSGDATLRYVGEVLKRNLKADELCARGEADNFFLCLKESDRNRIQSRMERILEDVNSFNKNREEPYFLTISQGAYLVEQPSMDIMLIQDRAKTACRTQRYQSQQTVTYYDSAITRQLQKEHELSDLFRNSIQNHDFQVYLQPKVCPYSGRIMGAEALVRWQHPKRGMIYPSEFIPLFERNGNICCLDNYMFEEVCALIARWIKNKQPVIPISVNLSRQHFKNPDLLPHLSEIARKYLVPDGVIELELTESVFFDDGRIEIVKGNIKTMHQLGFLCSLDDFGTGYSSLGLLKEFDIDTIKLDRKFAQDITNPKSQHILACIMELTKNLNIKTVAEGIETQEQLDCLKGLHCDLIQGYLYSKPLPIPEFEQWAVSRLF